MRQSETRIQLSRSGLAQHRQRGGPLDDPASNATISEALTDSVMAMELFGLT